VITAAGNLPVAQLTPSAAEAKIQTVADALTAVAKHSGVPLSSSARAPPHPGPDSTEFGDQTRRPLETAALTTTCSTEPYGPAWDPGQTRLPLTTMSPCLRSTIFFVAREFRPCKQPKPGT
jgi:hypothetical protein